MLTWQIWIMFDKLIIFFQFSRSMFPSRKEIINWGCFECNLLKFPIIITIIIQHIWVMFSLCYVHPHLWNFMHQLRWYTNFLVRTRLQIVCDVNGKSQFQFFGCALCVRECICVCMLRWQVKGKDLSNDMVVSINLIRGTFEYCDVGFRKKGSPRPTSFRIKHRLTVNSDAMNRIFIFSNKNEFISGSRWPAIRHDFVMKTINHRINESRVNGPSTKSYCLCDTKMFDLSTELWNVVPCVAKKLSTERTIELAKSFCVCIMCLYTQLNYDRNAMAYKMILCCVFILILPFYILFVCLKRAYLYINGIHIHIHYIYSIQWKPSQMGYLLAICEDKWPVNNHISCWITTKIYIYSWLLCSLLFHVHFIKKSGHVICHLYSVVVRIEKEHREFHAKFGPICHRVKSAQIETLNCTATMIAKINQNESSKNKNAWIVDQRLAAIIYQCFFQNVFLFKNKKNMCVLCISIGRSFMEYRKHVHQNNKSLFLNWL